MMRCAGWLIVLLVCSAPARAQETKPAPKPLLETWQAAYFEGLKVGHTHTVVREVKKDDRTIIRTTRTLNLVVKRYGSVTPMKVEQTTEETRAGKIRAFKLVYWLAKDKQVTHSGEIKDGEALVRIPNRDAFKMPWNDEAVGPYYQETVFQRRKVKAGDRFTMITYEPMILGILTLRVSVKGEEKVDRLVSRKKGEALEIVREPVRLVRADIVPDKIEIEGRQIPLPIKRFWLDARQLPVRDQFEQAGLGTVTFYNTTKKAALKEGVAPELLPDFGLNISIKLDQTVDRPYDTTRAVYRVTLTEPIDKVFVEDERQKVRNKKGKTFELVVRAVNEPAENKDGAEPGKQYAQSNHFIDSGNDRVRALAKKAVGSETDAWKKAKLVEKWVNDNMKVSAAVGFPTAGQIARDLEGDCRQHALLTAAMCRAVGLPSRTAIGVVYGRTEGRDPQFIFHMWTEVWVKGQWLGLDAILGKVGATHLKMGEHSWDKTVTLAPLLPISAVLGKIRIEIVSTR